MVKISLFVMCFAIFLDLNIFFEEVGKLFVGAGEGVTRPAPKNDIFRDGSVATLTNHSLYKRVKFWSVLKKIEAFLQIIF